MTGPGTIPGLDDYLTPDDPPEDYTENMAHDVFAQWLWRWFEQASSTQQNAVTDWINQQYLKEMRDDH